VKEWFLNSKNRFNDYKAKMKNWPSIMGLFKKVTCSWKRKLRIDKNLRERSCLRHKYGKTYTIT